MAVGSTGRIVVYLEPELKRRLHARLRSEGRDFKGWLLERIEEYLGAPRESEGVPQASEEPAPALGELERRVLEAVSSDARALHHVDDLVEATGLGIPKISEVLLRLELQGCIVQQFGRYKRVRAS